MKTDKTQLIEAIEAIKKKIASIEEELNKPDEIKHFPSKGDIYYFHTSIGILGNTIATDDNLKINTYKTREEAFKAYNKAIALEKVKRRILELQGDWKPDWKDENEKKYYIFYEHENRNFKSVYWVITQYNTSIYCMKDLKIAETIIEEMEDELKLIFDIQ